MTTPNNPAKQKLVKVYTAFNEVEARMVQEVLDQAGIESVINADLAPGVLSAMAVLRMDLLVLESAAPEAERILSELPNQDQPDQGNVPTEE
jgi:putative signal transducing protein